MAIDISKGQFCQIKRPARIMNKYQFSTEERYNVARLGSMRIWGLKAKIQRLMRAEAQRGA